MSVLALLLALSAHGPSAKPKDIELYGEVKEVSGPTSSRPLLIVDGGQYQLHGRDDASVNELKRLAGAKVRIYGVTGDPRIPGGKHVMVDRYEIVEVGGVHPRVGLIAKIELDGATKLLFVDETGVAELLPDAWGKKVKDPVGAKVWMIGSRNGKEFSPERFQILRETEEKR